MVFYKILLDGTNDDIQSLVSAIAETDEFFEGDETEKEYDFMQEGAEDLDYDALEEMSIDMANAAPNSSFTIIGEESNHGYDMAFEISFSNKELISKHSDWYMSYFCCKRNYENYEVFCEDTDLGDKVSKEQFERFVENEDDIAVLDSGDGEVVVKKDIPYYSNKIDWE